MSKFFFDEVISYYVFFFLLLKLLKKKIRVRVDLGFLDDFFCVFEPLNRFIMIFKMFYMRFG